MACAFLRYRPLSVPARSASLCHTAKPSLSIQVCKHHSRGQDKHGRDSSVGMCRSHQRHFWYACVELARTPCWTMLYSDQILSKLSSSLC